MLISVCQWTRSQSMRDKLAFVHFGRVSSPFLGIWGFPQPPEAHWQKQNRSGFSRPPLGHLKGHLTNMSRHVPDDKGTVTPASANVCLPRAVNAGSRRKATLAQSPPTSSKYSGIIMTSGWWAGHAALWLRHYRQTVAAG